MSGSINIQHSAQDLENAYRANIPDFGIKRMMIAVALPIILGFALWPFDHSFDIWWSIKLSGILFLGMIATILILRSLSFYWWIPRVSKRIFAQQSDVRAQGVWSWDETGFRSSGLYGNVIIPWGDFYQWISKDEVLLIYRSEVMFHFLPLKSVEARAAAADIISHLTKAGVKMKKRT